MNQPMSDENNTWFLEKLRQRAEDAEARVKELEAERSATANHVLVEDERHDALLKAEAENAMLRRELSLISHLHPGPGEPGSIARRAIAAIKPDDEVARLRQRVKELEAESYDYMAKWKDATHNHEVLRQRLTEMERGSFSGVCRELRLQLDAAESRVAELEGQLADWKHSADNAMDERHDADELHCTCVPVLRAKIKKLEAGLTHYHKDAFCGCCGGVMHDSRDAICHVCSPEPEYVAAMRCIAQLEADKHKVQADVLRWAAKRLVNDNRLTNLADALERGEVEI